MSPDGVYAISAGLAGHETILTLGRLTYFLNLTHVVFTIALKLVICPYCCLPVPASSLIFQGRNFVESATLMAPVVLVRVAWPKT